MWSDLYVKRSLLIRGGRLLAAKGKQRDELEGCSGPVGETWQQSGSDGRSLDLRNIFQDFQTIRWRVWEKQINQGLSFGPEQLCEWCAIYKDSSWSLGEEQLFRGGKGREGRCIKDPKFYSEHNRFHVALLAVQLELSGGLVDAGTCCCTVVAKSTGSGAATSTFKSQIHFS